jgi:hypothetical protein
MERAPDPGPAFFLGTGVYEVDQLVSLESNLSPEPASPKPGYHEKDRLENTLSRLVCRGRISQRFAQRLIATDWLHARQW